MGQLYYTCIYEKWYEMLRSLSRNLIVSVCLGLQTGLRMIINSKQREKWMRNRWQWHQVDNSYIVFTFPNSKTHIQAGKGRIIVTKRNETQDRWRDKDILIISKFCFDYFQDLKSIWITC